MRLACLSTVYLLAVIFSTLNDSDCAYIRLGKRRREVVHNSPQFLNDNWRVYKLHQQPYTRDMEQDDFDEMSGDSEYMMEFDDATAQGMEEPEVLRMDRETFNGLDMDMKIELTKGLSAREWNRLLERFWVFGEEYEKNISIFCYTLQYDEERRLRMLEEALTEKLEYLFVGMSDLAYIPSTPEVIQLLERGLKVYPELRDWILATIYQLGYPTTKWHFSNTNEDVRLLKYLIETGSIRREAITGHLAEIVTLYPLKILTSLLTKKILTMEDACTIKLNSKAWDRGGEEYLKWAHENCRLGSDQSTSS